MTSYRKAIITIMLACSPLLVLTPLSRAADVPVEQPSAATAPAPSPAAPAATAVPAPVQPVPAATALSATVPAQAPVRIGYVDIGRIAEESSIGKAAKARFKERSDKVQAQIEAKQKQLEKQKAALEKKMPTLIPDQRRAKISEYEKKVDEFRAFLKNAEKEMQPLQEELTRNMTGATSAACDAYGREHGMAIISVRKDFLYLSAGVEATDITSDIIALMNAPQK